MPAMSLALGLFLSMVALVASVIALLARARTAPEGADGRVARGRDRARRPGSSVLGRSARRLRRAIASHLEPAADTATAVARPRAAHRSPLGDVGRDRGHPGRSRSLPQVGLRQRVSGPGGESGRRGRGRTPDARRRAPASPPAGRPLSERRAGRRRARLSLPLPLRRSRSLWFDRARGRVHLDVRGHPAGHARGGPERATQHRRARGAGRTPHPGAPARGASRRAQPAGLPAGARRPRVAGRALPDVARAHPARLGRQRAAPAADALGRARGRASADSAAASLGALPRLPGCAAVSGAGDGAPERADRPDPRGSQRGRLLLGRLLHPGGHAAGPRGPLGGRARGAVSRGVGGLRLPCVRRPGAGPGARGCVVDLPHAGHPARPGCPVDHPRLGGRGRDAALARLAGPDLRGGLGWRSGT